LKLRQGIGEQTIERLKRYAKENKLSMCESLLNLFIVKDEIDKKTTRINAELNRIAGLIEKYRQVKDEFSPSELTRSLVDEIGILRQLRNEGTEESTDRMYNIQELLSGISEYTDRTNEPSLEGFLQEVSLVTDIDTYDDKKNAVTLMTAHSAKGLEYPVVFITGLEEGIFPLSSSMLTIEELEEERRLFYVAITRAMNKLYMTYSLQRYRFGAVSYQMKSRFLNEVDISSLSYLKHSAGRSSRKKVVRVEGSSIRYEYYDNGDGEPIEDIFQEKGIKKGSIVYHNNFGKGRVIELSGRGDSKKAQIDFDSAGVKHIILKYANLRLG
ncbi:MAG: 3'-5' exonuclease, partial [Ignavibacteria bacterium]